jgi:hypothetical protein
VRLRLLVGGCCLYASADFGSPASSSAVRVASSGAASYYQVFADAKELARELGELGHVDLLMSSHILEDSPRVTGLLLDLQGTLLPRNQLHITPSVKLMGWDPSVASVIGREHPIGVAQEFWRRFARVHGCAIDVRISGADRGRSCGETLAALWRGEAFCA